MKYKNTPENIKKLRKKIGLTQKQCAILYNIGLRSWQKKEEINTVNSSKMSNVEFSYLLLLAGEHPDYILKKRQ